MDKTPSGLGVIVSNWEAESLARVRDLILISVFDFEAGQAVALCEQLSESSGVGKIDIHHNTQRIGSNFGNRFIFFLDFR
jgi:hypothetical protein